MHPLDPIARPSVLPPLAPNCATPAPNRYEVRGESALAIRHRRGVRFAAALTACFALVLGAQPALAILAPFTLGVKVDFPTGIGAYTLATGDLNGDGNTDLVVGNYNSMSVSVLLGNGIGGFGPKTDTPTGTIPVSVALGDLNGDGKLDLVVASYTSSNTVSVILGKGDGTFNPKTDFATGTTPISVAIADVNGDGRPDLVVSNNGSNNVSVLRGDGLGGFSPVSGSPFAAGSLPRAVAVGDVDGDGKPDLVVANFNSNDVTVLKGDGAFGFAPEPYSPVTAGTNPVSVAMGDLTNDGKPELVVTNFGGGTVSVLLNGGVSGFTAAAGSPFTTGANPDGIAIGDLNGDGLPDLAVTHWGGGNVSILLGDGSGSLAAGSTFTTGLNPAAVTVQDINGDGNNDLVLTNNSSNTVSLLLGNGIGSFGTRTDFATGAYPLGVAIGDVSGDNKPDLVTANRNDGTISLLVGHGDGTFQSKTDFPAGTNPTSLALGDLDGDGKPDLVVTNYYSHTLSVLLAKSLTTATAFATGPFPTAVAIGDVNGDSKPDLVVADIGTTKVSVLLGDGAGSVGSKVDFDCGTLAASVAIGDLNGDGKADLAVATGSSLVAPDTVSVLLGDGSGSFGAASYFVVGIAPVSVAIADFNGDGKRDLAVVNELSNTASVLLGNGMGQFPARSDFGTAFSPVAVAVADVNGDGRLDMVVACNGLDTVSVLLGDGAGGFGAKTDLLSGAEPGSVAIGDLNGDGRPDLAVANYVGNTVSVLLGLVPARTVLAASPNPTTQGAPLALTATVSPPVLGYGIPTGTVSFFDGFTRLGTSAVSPTAGGTGEATLTPLSPYLGSRSLTAVYGGDGKFFGSVSPAQSHLVVRAPVSVPNETPLAFALEAVAPSPARGSLLNVRFTLPTSAPAWLEMVDVSGRRLAEREVGSLGAGHHSVDLAAGRALAPGIYLLQLKQGANVRGARAVVLR